MKYTGNWKKFSFSTMDGYTATIESSNTHFTIGKHRFSNNEKVSLYLCLRTYQMPKDLSKHFVTTIERILYPPISIALGYDATCFGISSIAFGHML